MLPLRSHGRSWGLVEIYGDNRHFQEGKIATARELLDRVGRLVAELEHRV